MFGAPSGAFGCSYGAQSATASRTSSAILPENAGLPVDSFAMDPPGCQAVARRGRNRCGGVAAPFTLLTDASPGKSLRPERNPMVPGSTGHLDCGPCAPP
ncbi:hypothetical protein GCM10009857_10410 [Agromyces soli]